MNPKIDKKGFVGFKASIGCPCAPVAHQNGTQGAHNGATRSAKSWFWIPGGYQEQHQGQLRENCYTNPTHQKTELPRKELQRTMHTI